MFLKRLILPPLWDKKLAISYDGSDDRWRENVGKSVVVQDMWNGE